MGAAASLPLPEHLDVEALKKLIDDNFDSIKETNSDGVSKDMVLSAFAAAGRQRRKTILKSNTVLRGSLDEEGLRYSFDEGAEGRIDISAGHFIDQGAWLERPICRVFPPGKCYFTDEWGDATLIDKEVKGVNCILFTFALPDPTKPLGLSTIDCLLVKAADITDEEGNSVVRPYAPISTNATLGKFQLMIKIYEYGRMTQYLKNTAIGTVLQFRHIPKNIKLQYPFRNKKKIGIICKGTGITTILQLLNATLGNNDDAAHISMLYINSSREYALAFEELNDWAKNSGGRFTLTHGTFVARQCLLSADTCAADICVDHSLFWRNGPVATRGEHAHRTARQGSCSDLHAPTVRRRIFRPCLRAGTATTTLKYNRRN